MATTPSIKVIKTMTYRGAARTWSNRYHFNGGTPADAAHWTTFSDSVTTFEKAILINDPLQKIIATVGYAAGSDIPVFNKTYSINGTFSVTGLMTAPGDSAALIRYSTTARTAKNHPIYLYNYYHGVLSNSLASTDTLASIMVTAYNTYAAKWISGFSDGTLTLVRAGPNGASATGYLVEPMITHRDLKH